MRSQSARFRPFPALVFNNTVRGPFLAFYVICTHFRLIFSIYLVDILCFDHRMAFCRFTLIFPVKFCVNWRTAPDTLFFVSTRSAPSIIHLVTLLRSLNYFTWTLRRCMVRFSLISDAGRGEVSCDISSIRSVSVSFRGGGVWCKIGAVLLPRDVE